MLKDALIVGVEMQHMTSKSRELGRKLGDAHWEQIGITTGKIRFEDKIRN